MNSPIALSTFRARLDALVARCLPFESKALRVALAGWLLCGVLAAGAGFLYSAPRAATLRAQAAPLLELQAAVDAASAASEGIDLEQLQRRYDAARLRTFPSQLAVESHIGQLLSQLQNQNWKAVVTSLDSQLVGEGELTRTTFGLELQKAGAAGSAEISAALALLNAEAPSVDIERVDIVADPGSPTRLALDLATHSLR